MTEENRQDGGGDGALSSSLERVAKELVEFAAAQVHHVVSKAGGRVTDVAERAGESVQGAASLPKLGCGWGQREKARRRIKWVDAPSR